MSKLTTPEEHADKFYEAWGKLIREDLPEDPHLHRLRKLRVDSYRDCQHNTIEACAGKLKTRVRADMLADNIVTNHAVPDWHELRGDIVNAINKGNEILDEAATEIRKLKGVE